MLKEPYPHPFKVQPSAVTTCISEPFVSVIRQQDVTGGPDLSVYER